ncbi:MULTISPECIES: transglycosylase SLT domain-containing protein [unclassified Alistipes]|uniref:transglycosylase SLT domain-containing protein n=1 Tax=unclassified Alistipes TaxID=2608932 RepID=UPI00258B8193|nr:MULTISPECIES: transglycosylase SLT domain-containing protein [unclassified Alistipes]HUN14628.1 transglycosylase SLT domain-containing protein [Alistipes sp.]
MFRKSVLIFSCLMVLTSFCGFHTRWTVPALASDTIGPDYSLLMEGDYVISPYDELIRHISEEEGHDWRLISAMAYHESRFRSHLVSPRGARGLMQVMPSVARQFGVPVELIADPQINVRLANQLLSSIVDALQMAENTPARDRMSIMLACYNSGLGHVRDARRLARRDGRNPDSWDTVLDYLSLKALPEYYESELVRCGRFTGSGMTQAYVDDVLEYYHEYCKRAGR